MGLFKVLMLVLLWKKNKQGKQYPGLTGVLAWSPNRGDYARGWLGVRDGLGAGAVLVFYGGGS